MNYKTEIQCSHQAACVVKPLNHTILFFSEVQDFCAQNLCFYGDQVVDHSTDCRS